MADREKLSSEVDLVAVDGWIETVADEGKVGEMDLMLLKGVLEQIGANFELSEQTRESLQKFRNVDRRVGMDAVWGRERVKDYRIWLKHWVADYEQKTGKDLPVLEGTDTKTSGGLKFFTDLTVFAAGLMTFKDYQRITERRAKKGRLWQERDPKKPYKSTKYSSFPPGFPNEAWEKVKSQKKN